MCLSVYIYFSILLLFVLHARGRERLGYGIAGILGAIYIVIFNYTDARPIITDQRTVTSVFAVLFMVPIMRYLIKLNKLPNSLLELIGRASFNIFLVQMIYWLFAEKVYEIIHGTFAQLLVNLVVCWELIITGSRIQ